MFRQRTQSDETRQILAAVANETRPYTDPRATYAFAERYQAGQRQGQQHAAGAQ